MTAGNVNISRSTVTTSGGDIVAGDKTTYYAAPAELERIFQPILRAIQTADTPQKVDATNKVQALKDEIAKGEKANDTVLAKLIEGLTNLVPGAVSAVVGAFGTPILAGVAGPATKYVLDKIQGK